MSLEENIVFDYKYLEQLEKSDKNELNEHEIAYLLNWINFKIKEILIKESENFKGLCGYAADILSVLLSSLNIKFFQININKILKSNHPKHAITIVIFSKGYNNMYILDPTFRQFVTNNKFKQAVLNVENGLLFTEELLSNGYFKLTLENLKTYFDIFKLIDKDFSYFYDVSKELYFRQLFECDVHENMYIGLPIIKTPSQIKNK